MLCKNCGRIVDGNKEQCKCGKNPFGKNKNDFDFIEKLICHPESVIPADPPHPYESQVPKKMKFSLIAVILPICFVFVIAIVFGISHIPKLSNYRINTRKSDNSIKTSLESFNESKNTVKMIVYGLKSDKSQTPEPIEAYLPINEFSNSNEVKEIEPKAKILKNGCTISVNISNSKKDKDGNTYYYIDDYSGYSGYINSNYLKEESEVTIQTIELNKSVRFYKGSDSKDIYDKKIPTGETVTYYKGCESNNMNMLMVKYNENVGYILYDTNSNVVKETELNEKWYVKFDPEKEDVSISMYKKANPDSKVLKELKPNGQKAIKVTVRKKCGDMWEVEYDNITGYIHKSRLVKNQKYAITETTTTNIITSESTSTQWTSSNQQYTRPPTENKEQSKEIGKQNKEKEEQVL